MQHPISLVIVLGLFRASRYFPFRSHRAWSALVAMPKEEINIQTYGPTKLSPARNAGNAALLVGVALPAIYYWHFLAHVCTPTQHMKHFHTDQLLQFGTWAKADAWCAVGAQVLPAYKCSLALQL